MKHLNIRAKTIKHSEENRDVNVNLGLGNDFLDMIQKAQAPKETKIGNLESSKLKLLSFKGHYQESKPTELGEVLASHIHYKGLSSRKYKDNL